MKNNKLIIAVLKATIFIVWSLKLRMQIRHLRPAFIFYTIMVFTSSTTKELHGQTLKQSNSAPFVHPGMLHSMEDLQRMKNNVKDSIAPWATSWQNFLKTPFLSKTYLQRPLEVAGRGTGSSGMDNIARDGAAAYYNAIAWYVTGDEYYAIKTIEILNGWSYKLKLINGKDAVLCAGIYGYKYANAAEIIRYTYKGWKQEDIEQFKVMMKTVFYPVIKDFSTFANGNWETSCLPTIMSIGIFCDDRVLFDRAIRYYLDGAGDGALTHYIINDNGQCQESGRDQPHTQGGIGHMISACEIAWKQGIDLYGAVNNRLLKGLEYTAKYNLGNDVPFEPSSDYTGKYTAKIISPGGRGKFSFIYEMAYNHYVNRIGLDASFLTEAAAKTRPEGVAIDHPGFGTLLFSISPKKEDAKKTFTAPACPGPIIAKGTKEANKLYWAKSVNATEYTVRRSLKSGGPYAVIANHIVNNAYTDTKVIKGITYCYVVSASNTMGTSMNTLETGICAGLPKSWIQQDIGKVIVQGLTGFDGHMFTLTGSGIDIAGTDDQLQFAGIPVSGNCTLTARFIPQVPSQFAKFGLMIRQGLTSDAPQVSLLFTPEATKDIEVPSWKACLYSRSTRGAELKMGVAGPNLEAPVVTWGRLLEPYWLRISRSENQFTAYVSPDGITWTQLGQVSVSLKNKLFVGLAVCSRLTNTTTNAMFDKVTIKN